MAEEDKKYLDTEGLTKLIELVQGMPDGVTLQFDPEGGLRIKDAGITADKLAANAVTTGKIAAGAVTSDSIAAGAVTVENISEEALSWNAFGGFRKHYFDEKITSKSVSSLMGGLSTPQTTGSKKLSNGNLVFCFAAQSLRTSDKFGFIKVTEDAVVTGYDHNFSASSIDPIVTGNIMSFIIEAEDGSCFAYAFITPPVGGITVNGNKHLCPCYEKMSLSSDGVINSGGIVTDLFSISNIYQNSTMSDFGIDEDGTQYSIFDSSVSSSKFESYCIKISPDGVVSYSKAIRADESYRAVYGNQVSSFVSGGKIYTYMDSNKCSTYDISGNSMVASGLSSTDNNPMLMYPKGSYIHGEPDEATTAKIKSALGYEDLEILAHAKYAMTKNLIAIVIKYTSGGTKYIDSRLFMLSRAKCLDTGISNSKTNSVFYYALQKGAVLSEDNWFNVISGNYISDKDGTLKSSYPSLASENDMIARYEIGGNIVSVSKRTFEIYGPGKEQ